MSFNSRPVDRLMDSRFDRVTVIDYGLLSSMETQHKHPTTHTAPVAEYKVRCTQRVVKHRVQDGTPYRSGCGWSLYRVHLQKEVFHDDMWESDVLQGIVWGLSMFALTERSNGGGRPPGNLSPALLTCSTA